MSSLTYTIEEANQLFIEGKYKEIEFVCHNSEFCDATDLKQQKKLFSSLKRLKGVMPYRQDWSDKDNKQISLAVVITDKENESKLLKTIKQIAKDLNVKIDIIDYINDSKLDSILNKTLENIIVEELYLEDTYKDYYVLYHSTDSDFFDSVKYDMAKKGDRFFNPLGNGLYFSTNKDFSKGFGKNTFYYLLPKSAKIKKVTFKSWTQSTFLSIVKKVLKKYNKDYWKDTDISDKVEINRLGTDAPISSLNEFSEWLKIKYDVTDPQPFTKFIQT